ncbi:MAG: 3-hydroxybutyryl-CoA dehydrogenase [Holosporaceae bacterium]|jgi:3-hydroxybutyryl-CoA dehydrogenase|nr:3-hydroxybutyryl-CoA dehydrogenase [Holosporaceae bacterium]
MYISRVAIIGAGQMGSGIAQVFATAGYFVKIYDLSEEIFKNSRKRISDSLKKFEAKCLIDEKAELVQERISYCPAIVDLSDCKIFIESIFEDYAIKMEIFRRISEILKPTSLVATNTSSYSITKLSLLIPYPENFIGFHFMNPPQLMNLLEIIRGQYTYDSTFDFFWHLAKDLKKIPICSKNSPGFVLNRILIPMINEAIFTLLAGISSREQIDAAMKLGAGHPQGPLALADLIGLDTVLSIMKTLQRELDEVKYTPCPLLESYVEQGFLGKKSGKGFYEY